MKKSKDFAKGGQVPSQRDDLHGLPSADHAERAVLGCIMLRNETYFHVCEIVRPEDFTLDSNQRIYSAMMELMNSGVPVDTVTLAEHLSKKRVIQSIGGVAYLASLTDGQLAHGEHAAHCAREVREVARRRSLFKQLVDSQRTLLDRDVSLDSVIGQIESSLIETTAETAKGKAQRIEEFSRDVFMELMELRQRKREIAGLRTGLDELDNATTGLRDGEIFVVAARPGIGKSAFALGMAIKNASHDVPVGYFSLEMRKDELLLRALSHVVNINHGYLRRPTELAEDEVNKISEVLVMMNKWPLWIDDGVLDITELIARARMLVSRGAKLIIVDFIQRVRVRSEQDTRLKINVASAALAEFAKSLKIPVVVLSQLKRLENPNARPGLHNLKESGNLEEDAHAVALLYRPMTRDGQFTHEDEVILAKQRSGVIGSIPAYFHGKTLTWNDREVTRKSSDDEKQAKLSAGAQ